MRVTPKYKIFYQSKRIVGISPLRILKFRRTKWSKLQKFISKKTIPQKLAYKNNFVTRISLKYWVKLKWNYKNSLLLKSLSKQFSDGLIKTHSNRLLRNRFHYRFLDYLIKPYFKIDVLLWKLNFFNSRYESRQFINEGFVLVNNKKVKPNLFVKKGDFITFSNESFTHTPQNYIINNQSAFGITFFTFIEADYYSKSFVIIKDSYDLSKEDFYFLTKTYFDIKKL